jgi:hypothetical protein
MLPGMTAFRCLFAHWGSVPGKVRPSLALFH